MAYSGKKSDLDLKQMKLWFNPSDFTCFSLGTGKTF